MIKNILSLNKITINYRITFDSGDENTFKVHIGDNIVKFPENDDFLYISKLVKNILGTRMKRKKVILLKY